MTIEFIVSITLGAVLGIIIGKYNKNHQIHSKTKRECLEEVERSFIDGGLQDYIKINWDRCEKE